MQIYYSVGSLHSIQPPVVPQRTVDLAWTKSTGQKKWTTTERPAMNVQTEASINSTLFCPISLVLASKRATILQAKIHVISKTHTSNEILTSLSDFYESHHITHTRPTLVLTVWLSTHTVNTSVECKNTTLQLWVQLTELAGYVMLKRYWRQEIIKNKNFVLHAGSK